METNLVGTFDTFEMLEAINATPRPRTFFRETCFGGRQHESLTKYVTADFMAHNRALAPFVNRYMGGKLIEKTPFESRRYEPPMVAPRAVFRGDEAFERGFGEVIGGNTDPDSRMAQLTARELNKHDLMVTRREEWMIAQLLTTGVITIVGEGVTDSIDLNHTNQVVLSGTSLWGQADAEPIMNLRDWKRQVIRLSGITPDTMVLGATAAKEFLKDSQVQSLLDNRRMNLGNVNPRDVPSGAIYIGTIEGVDIYEYPEWYIDDATGTEMPLIPDTAAILFPSAARNPGALMVYGAYYDMAKKAVVAGARIPRSWIDEPKNVQFTELVSMPLPVIPHVDSWLIATVTA